MEQTKEIKLNKNKELSAADIARKAGLHIVYFLLGLLISKGAVLGSLAPFGASLAASVPFSFIPAVSLGSSLGYILLGAEDTFRYIAVIAAIGALRWLLNDIRKISASLLFAPIIAFVTIASTGVALLFVSTSRMTEFSLCILEAVVSAAGAFFLYKSASLMTSSRALGAFSKAELACLAFSGCIILLSFGEISILGVSLGRLLAVLVVLLCAGYGGITGGSLGGIATGVIFSISSFNMAFLGIGYAFGGLCAGLFSSMGKIATAVSFTLANTVLSFACKDSSLFFALFAETAFAVAIYMLIPKSLGNRLKPVFSDREDSYNTAAMQKNVIMRLSFASKALDSVKDCVNSVSEKLRAKSSDEAKYIYTFAAESTCRACGLKSYCWQNQKDVTADDFNKAGEILKSEGYITDKDIDRVFVKKCCKSRELAKSINEGYKEYLAYLAADRRITQVRAVMAGQFGGVSRLLGDMCDEFENFNEYDIAASERITEALRREDYIVTDCACRKEDGRGMGVELEIAANRKKEINKTKLRKLLSSLMGRAFDIPVISASGDRVRLMFSQLARYDAEIGTSQHIAGSKELCGDCMSYFVNGSGNMVAAISDGMGTGGRAAVDSNMAISILKKLSQAGLSYDSALSVINSSLMIKSEDESLATLDITDINLFSGKVTFLKAGAPITYVKRSGRIIKREAPSLPVGILSDIKFAKDSLTLHHHDRILMVSDGALFGDDGWIIDMIKAWESASAADFASLVVNEAIKRRNDGYDDDITAVAIHIIDLSQEQD